MSLPILEYTSPDTTPARPLMTVLEKCMLIALGVVLPLVCFAIACGIYPAEPEYQSGEWDRYIRFVPDGHAGFPFYPLLIYSLAALCAFVIRPALSRLLLVRFGLYTGIVLALQYTWIQSLMVDKYSPVAIVVGLASGFIPLGFVKLLERIPRRVFIYLAIGAAVLFALAAVVEMLGGRPMRELAGIPLVGGLALLIVAPAWCAGVYVRAALLARRVNAGSGDKGSPVFLLLCWVPWLGAYAAAWKWSIANAVVLYSRLPTSAPGCYIATAAASGHPKFVGSAPAVAVDGTVFQASQQLRRLKCVEIAMAIVCPAAHRSVRQIYDVAGPPMARAIASHPLLADLAFVTLKPVEWLAFGALVAIVPEMRREVAALYPHPCASILSAGEAEVEGSGCRAR